MKVFFIYRLFFLRKPHKSFPRVEDIKLVVYRHIGVGKPPVIIRRPVKKPVSKKPARRVGAVTPPKKPAPVPTPAPVPKGKMTRYGYLRGEEVQALSRFKKEKGREPSHTELLKYSREKVVAKTEKQVEAKWKSDFEKQYGKIQRVAVSPTGERMVTYVPKGKRVPVTAPTPKKIL